MKNEIFALSREIVKLIGLAAVIVTLAVNIIYR